MAVNKIFQSSAWKKEVPELFRSIDGVILPTSRTDVKSMYTDTTPYTAKMYPPTLQAVLGLINANHVSEGNKEREDFPRAAVGLAGDFVVAELEDYDGTIDVVVYDPSKGIFKASVFNEAGDGAIGAPYILKKDKKDGAALILALIGPSPTNPEFMKELSNISKFAVDTRAYTEDTSEQPSVSVSKAAVTLCDNIYSRVNRAEDIGDDGIKVVIPSTSNIRPISRISIQQGVYSPNNEILGEFRILTGGRTPSSDLSKSLPKDITGKYAFSEREFNESEKVLIPTIPDWYVMPKSVIRICQHAKSTTESKMPMRNFMLRGPAGVGKTEAARATAAGFNLPYLTLTCSANTEIFDLLGQILPDIEGMDSDNKSTPSDSTLPTFQDIQLDPGTAYFKLTGTYDEDITEEAVYEKLVEVLRSGRDKNEETGSGGQKFKYVETPLVKAMKYGYVIEIQEPSVIANPGVLVGLNSLLDNCKQITLPTGETIQRHPDTVVIVTTNNDYSGCRDINQSVISRMNLVMDIDEPTEKEVMERVTAITGFDDEDVLKTMVDVVTRMQKHCRETLITDGSCGMRELISWVDSFKITLDMAESAEYTILSSATADPESREVLRSTCVGVSIAD